MADDKPSTIIAIDLTRFCCALLVVWHHYALAMWTTPDTRVTLALQGVAAAPIPLAQTGLVGVELFFVISGLVIAQSAAHSGWLDFLRRRLLRMAPAAWICASLTALLLVASGQANAALFADWARSMRFWPVGAQIDGSYWTIGVECAFYLLVAMAAAGRARRILLLGWGMALASAIFWATCLALGDQAQAVITNQAAILLLLPHGCIFAIGIALAQRGGRSSAALLALALATASYETVAHIGGGHLTTMTLAALAIFGGGIVVLASTTALQPWLARWIDARHARTIGLMTYPLYLLHQCAGAVLIGALARHGLPRDGATIATLIMMLAMSWAIATYAEPALRSVMTRQLSRSRGPFRDSRRIAFPPAG